MGCSRGSRGIRIDWGWGDGSLFFGVGYVLNIEEYMI